MNFEKFLDLMRELDGRKVDYVLVGGAALNVHGIVRATEKAVTVNVALPFG